jgi:ENTS family enterobactin (siderophore) exporter
VIVDTSPLKQNRGFQWLFGGELGGLVSRQIIVVVVPYEVYVRTGSSWMVGLVGLVQVAPLVGFSFIGGVIADAFDRRLVLVIAEISMGLCCLGFAFNTGSRALWLIFALISVDAAMNGLENPAKSAVIPSLVGKDQLASAMSVHLSMNQLMQILGPATAGILLAHTGIRTSYLVAAACAFTSAVALIPMGRRKPIGASESLSFRASLGGWNYLRAVPVLQQMMMIDFSAMTFGMPRALFPAMGIDVLMGDATTVGLLHAAPGIGALIAALLTGWVTAVRRQGRAIVVSVVMYGAAIAAFGFSRTLWVALVLLALAGAADIVSNIFRNVVLQESVPDDLRGRVSALKGALAEGGPRLGDAVVGGFATVVGPAMSLATGGLLTSLSAVTIAGAGRSIWRQKVSDLSISEPGSAQNWG